MTSLLKNWRFMRLFSGRIITNIGDSIYYIAAMWLVYELGGSSFHTGLAGFLVLIPQAVQFLAGPLVDRWSLRKTLFFTQLVQGVLVAIIPIAFLYNFLTVNIVLIVIPFISLLNQFAYPAQTAALPIILKKEELVKGNSLFSFAYQGIDMALNSIAGILISVLGVVSLFFINSITFFIAAFLFLSIRLSKEPVEVENKPSVDKDLKLLLKIYWIELTDGLKYVFKSIIAKLFVAIIVANFAIGATFAVLPAYGDFLGGPEYYGYLMAALSAGTLLGALLASVMDRFPLGKLTIVAFLIGIVFWISSIFIPIQILSVIFFGLAWVPLGVTNVVMNSAIIGMIPQKLIARTITVAASIGTIMMPIGSLLGGYVATILHVKIVFGLLSFGFLFISIYWLLNSSLRNLPQPSKMNAEEYGLHKFNSSNDKPDEINEESKHLKYAEVNENYYKADESIFNEEGSITNTKENKKVQEENEQDDKVEIEEIKDTETDESILDEEGFVTKVIENKKLLEECQQYNEVEIEKVKNAETETDESIPEDKI